MLSDEYQRELRVIVAEELGRDGKGVVLIEAENDEKKENP